MMTNFLFDGLLAGRAADTSPLMRVADGATWSYADLVGLSGRLAHQLQALGVQAGDRVAVQVDKSVEAIALYLATIRAGAVFLPLNTAYTRAEVGYFLEDAEPRVFVCSSKRKAEFEGIEARLTTLDGDGGGSLMQAAQAHPVAFDDIARGPRDLAAILYTSGWSTIGSLRLTMCCCTRCRYFIPMACSWPPTSP
jgi:malonyl-CoA/methylmalonyl-CoA synthetase